MIVVVNNSKRSEEIEFRERVKRSMQKQILKKLNNESKFFSSELPKADKAICPKSGDALLYMEANEKSNSTLRTFSSDK